ncbi:cobalt transporter CbiM [Fuchsiella alkaliacetigena]|uniref:cobalt transporter CbiM n=1 Tax=Fuchsiella alkaliacetigena TaxID=957042 RepID=UPI00200B9B9B|nr:cobalt transporter CbiM [Fuchsiella alkaliacetigena]MCK8823638.1 cobalt transporter CbiM [Fuchsiella alkaliacetigena]
MHISEGVLAAPVLAAGAAVAAGGVAVGLKDLDDQDIPKTSIITSALFIASLIHVPLGPTSVHLVLNGLAGVFLGWKVFPAFLIAFFLQAVLFQHGGLTTLGVNVSIVAVPALICYYLFRSVVERKRGGLKVLSVSSFVCGALGVLLTVIMLMFALVFTQDSFMEMANLILLSHLPVMLIEGVLTAICVVFIVKTKPEAMQEIELSSLNL